MQKDESPGLLRFAVGGRSVGYPWVVMLVFRRQAKDKEGKEGQKDFKG